MLSDNGFSSGARVIPSHSATARTLSVSGRGPAVRTSPAVRYSVRRSMAGKVDAVMEPLAWKVRNFHRIPVFPHVDLWLEQGGEHVSRISSSFD
jgi:hypothetical protein